MQAAFSRSPDLAKVDPDWRRLDGLRRFLRQRNSRLAGLSGPAGWFWPRVHCLGDLRVIVALPQRL